MSRNRITTADLKVGEPIPAHIYDESGALLFKKGLVIASQRQLELLISRNIYFHVGIESIAKVVAFSEEPTLAFEMIDSMHEQMTALYRNLRTHAMREKELGAKIHKLVSLLQKACDTDADAVLADLFFERPTSYSVRHSIHTAIVCELVARADGVPIEQKTSLVSAALTMNVAMFELQDQLFSQPSPLSAEQKAHIGNHPVRGVEILRQLGINDEEWLTLVLQHHELEDGSGYPSGLLPAQVNPLTPILTCADIYCAKIYHRGYRPAIHPDVALREMFKGIRGPAVSQKVATTMIKVLGVYPPGCFVRLQNGEAAIVTHRGEKAHLPFVHSLARPNGTRLTMPIHRDTQQAAFAIKSSLPRKEVDINLNRSQLWSMLAKSLAAASIKKAQLTP